jgi:hypothetical protein
MRANGLLLAAEDSVGLALGSRLIREHPDLTIFRAEDGQGFGRLRAYAEKYNDMAKNGVPVVLLTDLDRQVCPMSLVEEWMGGRHAPHPEFLLRVCVREAEAWVMADCEAVARFLGIRSAEVPSKPEQLPDPKQELLRLARRCTRNLRNGLLPAGNSKAQVGWEYNRLLTTFIEEHWNPASAGARAPSLQRARQRIAELSDRIRLRSR